MAFVSTFVTYVIIFLIATGLGFAAVMIGKKLRDNKNKREPVNIPDDKQE